jgi:sec-independent protein translocase protein TatC
VNNLAEMSIGEHLEELRWRLLYSIAAILITTLIGFFFSDAILKLLVLPAGGLQLKAFNLMDGFLIKWDVALIVGVPLAFPVWGYHLYGFISKGLFEHERKSIFPVLCGSLVLFVLGVSFGYYLLWGIIRVMRELFPAGIDFLPAADGYISFIVFFLVGCGTAFQLPTLLIFLVQLRILNANILKKQRKIAYFALFVFSEVITPVSDPIIAPLTVMVPLIILYEISIWVAMGIEKSRPALVEPIPLEY